MSADPAERISQTVQELFRLTPLLLVGSGFSCGYGLPSMPDLGDHLMKCVTPRLASASAGALWASVLPAIKIDLEQGLNTIASGAAGRDEVVAAIREETARLIIHRTREAEACILSSANPWAAAPARLLKRLYSGAPQNAECIPVITYSVFRLAARRTGLCRRGSAAGSAPVSEKRVGLSRCPGRQGYGH